jgi:PBP1b-binding outer membrane lipoprotein LpoB
MKQLVLFAILFSSCTKELVMNQCDASKYYSSSKQSSESTFKNNQREIFTVYSLADFQTLYRDTDLSCLDVLSNHFYCNLCFENSSNRLISYSGKRIDFSSDLPLMELMDAVLGEISQMDLGSDEYESFIDGQ